jgi:hypothetical protein
MGAKAALLLRECNRRSGAARQATRGAGALCAALTGRRAGLVTAMTMMGRGVVELLSLQLRIS